MNTTLRKVTTAGVCAAALTAAGLASIAAPANAQSPDKAVWVLGGGDAAGYRFGAIAQLGVSEYDSEFTCKAGRMSVIPFLQTMVKPGTNVVNPGSPPSDLYVGPCFKVENGKTDSDFLARGAAVDYFADPAAVIDYTRSDGAKITVASLSDGWHFGIFDKSN